MYRCQDARAWTTLCLYPNSRADQRRHLIYYSGSFLHRSLIMPLKFINDRAAAEDVVQDVFVRLWERRERFIQVKSMKSYLYTAVRNEALLILKETRRQSPLYVPGIEDTNAEHLLIAADTAREIFQLLESLPPKQQEVLRLTFL